MSDPLQHLPPVDILVARLASVEQQLADLAHQLQTPLSPQDRNGVLAHIAALSRRKTWYVSRIRKDRPVQALGVSVEDEVSSGDRPR